MDRRIFIPVIILINYFLLYCAFDPRSSAFYVRYTRAYAIRASLEMLYRYTRFRICNDIQKKFRNTQIAEDTAIFSSTKRFLTLFSYTSNYALIRVHFLFFLGILNTYFLVFFLNKIKPIFVFNIDRRRAFFILQFHGNSMRNTFRTIVRAVYS